MRNFLKYIAAASLAFMPIITMAQTTVPSYTEAASGTVRNGIGVLNLGSAATAQQIQGAFANGATGAANPVTIGLQNGTVTTAIKSLTGSVSFTNGTDAISAGLISQYNTTLPSSTNGSYGVIQMTSDNSWRSALVGPLVNSGAVAFGYTFPYVLGSSSIAHPLGVGAWLYNGSTGLNASVDAVGAKVSSGNTGAGVAAVEEGGRPFSEITSATTTLINSGAGILHSVNVNTCVAAATIKIYNALTATGTPITITCGATAAALPTLVYDDYFGTGITVVTSGATDVTVTYR